MFFCCRCRGFDLLSLTLVLCSDCEGALKCFQRDGDTNVPGCSGDGTSDWDYCYLPEITGFQGTPCSDGIFLRPSVLANQDWETVDVGIVTKGICVWVEVAEERDGGFQISLPGTQGFIQYDTGGTSFALTNIADEVLAVDLFCTGTDHVTLPATLTAITSHGICSL